MSRSLALAGLAAVGALTGCGSHPASAGSGGAGGHPGSGGAGGALEQSPYPDLAALHALGVAPTCSRNEGVCHRARDYPELGSANDLLAAVGAPCQLGIQEQSATLDACEVPGDLLAIGGQDLEILRAIVAPGAPFPLDQVDLQLAAAPPSLDLSGARIHRPAPAGDLLSRPLMGVTASAGSDPKHVLLALAGAADPTLTTFLDVRAWHGDRVRVGDPNGNGIAHAATAPWAEITPGDPGRSLFYQRLLSDQYGPVMPLIPRTWSPSATRAVWCWIRGLPAGATPLTSSVHDPIDYAHCPPDPDAPDPNAAGGWPAVKVLIASKCATAACHAPPTRSAMLDLTPTAASFAKGVINAPSSQQPGVLRVVPGQPAASYLLCKVSAKCASRAPNTGLMPLNGTPLADDEVKTISDWIVNGAPTE